MVEFNKTYADRLIDKPELTLDDIVVDEDGNNIFMSILIDEEYAPIDKYEYIKNLSKNITTTDVFNQVNNEGNTALMIAARNSAKINNREDAYGEYIVKMLIDAGANLDIQNKYGSTALIFAADNSNHTSTENTVKMLIDAGANLDIQDENGSTALIFAVDNIGDTSTENTVKMLIDSGANLDIQDENKTTALMIAIDNIGDTSADTEKNVRMLIDAGANLDIQDENGLTALMIAIDHIGDTSTENIKKTVKMLIDAGANLDIQNEYGLTAYDNIPEGNELRELFGVDSDEVDGVDEVDDALSALLSQRIRINITKDLSFTDPITMEEENINICDYIEEDKDNIVIIYNKNDYFFTTRQIISTQKDDATVYPCVRTSHALIPHRENVISTKPLYDLKKIGFVYSFFCDMKHYFNNPDNQLFAIINTKQEYPSFVSDRIFSGRDHDVVSGLHCQEGQESKISYMIVAIPSTKDNPDTIQMRGKQNTRKQNTRKQKTRKQNNRKQNTRKQNTRKQNTRKQNTRKQNTRKQNSRKQNNRKQNSRKQNNRKQNNRKQNTQTKR
jgi:ankyrin repeat protein